KENEESQKFREHPSAGAPLALAKVAAAAPPGRTKRPARRDRTDGSLKNSRKTGYSSLSLSALSLFTLPVSPSLTPLPFSASLSPLPLPSLPPLPRPPLPLGGAESSALSSWPSLLESRLANILPIASSPRFSFIL